MQFVIIQNSPRKQHSIDRIFSCIFCYILDDMAVIHTLLKMIIRNRPLLFQAKSSFLCSAHQRWGSPTWEKLSNHWGSRPAGKLSSYPNFTRKLVPLLHLHRETKQGQGMDLNRERWSPASHPPIAVSGDSEVGLLRRRAPAQVCDNAAGTGCTSH